MYDPHHLPEICLRGPKDGVQNEQYGAEAHHELVHSSALPELEDLHHGHEVKHENDS